MRSASAIAILALLAGCSGAKPTKWINSFAGPFITYVDKIQNCADAEMDKSSGYFDMQVRLSHWSPRRPSEPQIANGIISLINMTVDDDKTVVMSLATRSNNQWKENAFIFRKPTGACSFTRSNMPGMWHSFFGQDVAKGGRCHVPEGRYTLRNSTTVWDTPNFPVMPYGHYRALIHGRHERRQALPCLCVKADIHLVPRIHT